MLLHCIGRYLSSSLHRQQGMEVVLHPSSSLFCIGCTHSKGNFPLQSISRSNYITQNHCNNHRAISKLNIFRLKLENCQLKLSVECNNQGCAVEVFRCKFKNLNLNHQLWQADFLAKFLLYFPAQRFVLCKNSTRLNKQISALHFFQISHYGVLYLQPQLKLELLTQASFDKLR